MVRSPPRKSHLHPLTIPATMTASGLLPSSPPPIRPPATQRHMRVVLVLHRTYPHAGQRISVGTGQMDFARRERGVLLATLSCFIFFPAGLV